MTNNYTIVLFVPVSNKTAYLPQSAVAIGDFAFAESPLQELYANTELTHIGYAAFQDCTELFHIHLQENVQEIGFNAFLGCTKLKCGCVIIPDNVKKRIDFKNVQLSPALVSKYCQSIGCWRYSCFQKRDSLNSAVLLHNVFF